MDSKTAGPRKVLSYTSIARQDWSETQLGNPQGWPEALRHAVALIDRSGFPMFIVWGPSRVLVYNDAYIPILAERHPSAQGRAFWDVWPERREPLEPIVEAAFEGQATFFEDLKVDLVRSDAPLPAWFTFSYSPIEDLSGGIPGVLCVGMETTSGVLAREAAEDAQRRQHSMFEQAPGFICILEGPEHVFRFTNHTHRRLFGRDMTGKAVRKAFPELEGQGFFELLDQVYRTGERYTARAASTLIQAVPDGPLEERFLDFVYEPMRNAQGQVHGIFCEGSDATEATRERAGREASEARLRFLDTLAQATASLNDADDLLTVTTRMTAEHLGVSNCAYADMDNDRNGFTIRGDWAAPGSPSIVGHYKLADFGELAVQELGAGRPLIINDNAKEIAPEEAATFQAIGIAATICMPLVKDGRLSALMAIHSAIPHIWTADELSLIREVTARSWAHIERVGAEAALRESEAKYRSLFDTIDEGFCLIEFVDGPEGPLSDYIHIEANAAAAQQTGLESVAGRSIRQIAGQEAQPWVDLYGEVLRTGTPVRFEREFLPTGRWLELAAFRVEPPERRQVAVLFKDLTARRQAELALRESEAQFRAFAEAVPNHVWASRPDGSLYWFNSQVYTYSGLSEGQLDGPAGWGDIVHPDDLPGVAAIWAKALETGEVYSAEFRLRRADGSWRWFFVRAEPVYDEAGDLTGWVGANSDIDDIRRQGEQLVTLNAQLEMLLEGSKAERDRLWTLSTDALARADYAGGLIAVNPAWTEILGWSERELLTNPYADIIDPEDLPATAAALAEMGKSGEPKRFENRILSKAGVWTPMGWTVAPEPDGLHFIAVGRDLTEDKVREHQLATVQEALRQSQKMEAVGQLTGGIAHDFNNLLAGISGSLELLGKRLSEGRLNGMERYIDAAQGSAQRAAALTQRLLAFSRRQTLDPKPTDVNRLINGMEDLIRRSVGPDVEVEVVGAGGLWATKIDQSQLENALLNLCNNARDAMAPAGGRLTIETSNKWLDDRAARARDLPPGQYVSLCVTDTGTGMPPEVQTQAFDPFFTTKPLGQGTGLGLSMIHGFVRQSGGQVRIYSEMGKGTTMCLYLPRHLGGVDGEEQASATAVAEGGHGETVLVIDDEETVRMLVAEVLGDAGYHVIDAPDGPSGLEILRSDRRIDLLISDVGLPGGMNGRQVADAARVSRPDLKVLFITGYAENAAVGNGLLATGMEILTKPFVMGDLAAKVHDMIDGGGQRKS